MTYFKITNMDVSPYVSGLKISKAANYVAQTNAAGNTVVDYINTKRTFELTIIPLSNEPILKALLSRINHFNFTITYRNPDTSELEEVNVMMPNSELEYYTIRADKVMYKAFPLTFVEL